MGEERESQSVRAPLDEIGEAVATSRPAELRVWPAQSANRQDPGFCN